MSTELKKCPVPKEQQPLHEYNVLKSTMGFQWTQSKTEKYIQINLALFGVLCLAWSIILFRTNSLENFTFKQCLVIINSSNICTILVLIRYYLGWRYVYSRLMNAIVTYEESGWYDGQSWVKSPETLIQDRLIGTYEVLPTLQRLKNSLGSSTLFLILGLLIFKYIIK